MSKQTDRQICAEYRNYVEIQGRVVGADQARLTAIRFLAETYARENGMPFQKAVEKVKQIVDYKQGSDADYGSFQ